MLSFSKMNDAGKSNTIQFAALTVTCGAMLATFAYFLSGQMDSISAKDLAAISVVADENRKSIMALSQQFQVAQIAMGDRVARVETKQVYDDSSVDRLTSAVAELTKELSTLEGVIADGRKK